MILLYFNKFEPNVRIEDAVTPKKGRTLIVKNHVEFAVELAAQNKQEDTDTQVNKALWKASRIMQLVLLKHEESHQLILKVLSNMTEEECRNS